ncbi:MAG: hypothetical protein WAU70_12095 [Flavobacteriales bacterium]
MKTLTSHLIMIGSIAMLANTPTPLMAQDMVAQANTGNEVDRLSTRLDENTAAQPARIDFVDAHFARVPYNGDAFLRTTTPLCSGTFSVRVVDANGTLRMTGSYADANLTIPNGPFAYFYDNGAIESSGSFSKGSKSGTWERYTDQGRRLADREYSGLDVDRLLEQNGLVAYARTMK